jgi:hypothetical protein
MQKKLGQNFLMFYSKETLTATFEKNFFEDDSIALSKFIGKIKKILVKQINCVFSFELELRFLSIIDVSRKAYIFKINN